MKPKAALLCLIVLGFAGSSVAQINPDTTRIVGTVVNQTAAELREARVELIHQASGRTYSIRSDPYGEFHFEYLPSGTYTIRAGKEGYQAMEMEVETVIGEELPVTLVLVEESWTDVVTVHSSVPKVPTTTTDSVTHIPTEVIESLPLNGRDFSDLVSLVPQVVGDPNERVHIGGGRGIFTTYMLDGVDNNSSFFGEERGGIRPTFTLSQTAVAEFQVSQVPFSAQYGGTAGGLVNAVTRSGNSTFRGDTFLFYRDEAFVADDANGREAEDFEQTQYGVTLGGPLSSRLFYFLSADIQDYSHPTFREWNDPNGMLDVQENWDYLDQYVDLDAETGTIPQTNNQEAYLFRLDSQLDERHSLNFRFHYSNQQGDNLSDNYRTTGFSNNGNEKDRFWSGAFHLTSLLSSSLANELVIQTAKEERPREANTTGIPEVTIGSSYDAVFGQKNYLPNQVDEEILEVRDNLTLFWRNHTLRAGFTAKWVDYMDWFYRYQSGAYFYESWEDFFNGQPVEFMQSFSDHDGRVEFSSTYGALYLQDSVRLNRLTLNAGLRYEEQSFSDPEVVNLLLPEGETVPDFSDFSPRLSFAYDLSGNGEKVLRGGWGRFVGTTPTILLATAYLFNGSLISTYYLSEDDPAMPVFPDVLEGPGDLAASTPNVYFFSEDFEQPRVDRALLEYEQDLGGGWMGSVGGHYASFDRLERKQDTNLNILGDNEYSTQDRPDSNFARKIVFLSDAWGRYAALTLQARYRGEKLFFHTHYTYSKSEDNDSNERSTSSRSFYPEDQYDLHDSWGKSDFDAPHRWVAYAVWRFHPRWSLSGQAIYQSGFPFTALSHEDDNGDGYYTDRATYGGKHYSRNSFRQPDFKTLDLRLSYTYPLGPGEIVAMLDVFNLLDFSNRTTDRLTYTTEDEDGNEVRRSDFGSENLAGNPRQFQVGIRYSF